MTVKLILIRHGNNFDKGDVVLRVGKDTDLPLSNSGKEQAVLLGKYFKLKNINPDVVFTSNLKRTIQTAEIALKEAGIERPLNKLEIFDEIDYGPDEGKPETEVVARIGQEALDKWAESAIVPDGWIVNPQKIIQSWKDFGKILEEKYDGKTVIVVSSNGVMRFVPHMTGDFENFAKNNKIKVKTGAVCYLHKDKTDANWTIDGWNERPKDFVSL